jgi:hypothetical protein
MSKSLKTATCYATEKHLTILPKKMGSLSLSSLDIFTACRSVQEYQKVRKTKIKNVRLKFEI